MWTSPFSTFHDSFNCSQKSTAPRLATAIHGDKGHSRFLYTFRVSQNEIKDKATRVDPKHNKCVREDKPTLGEGGEESFWLSLVNDVISVDDVSENNTTSTISEFYSTTDLDQKMTDQRSSDS